MILGVIVSTRATVSPWTPLLVAGPNHGGLPPHITWFQTQGLCFPLTNTHPVFPYWLRYVCASVARICCKMLNNVTDTWLAYVRVCFLLFRKLLFWRKLPTIATRMLVRRPKGATDGCTGDKRQWLWGDDDIYLVERKYLCWMVSLWQREETWWFK